MEIRSPPAPEIPNPPTTDPDFDTLKVRVADDSGIQNAAENSSPADSTNEIPVTGDPQGFRVVIVVQGGD